MSYQLKRVANGPSWGQVAKYPLIHLLDLRRRGWQVQSGRRSTLALVNIILRLLVGRSEFEPETAD
jgi:hypothetical protein